MERLFTVRNRELKDALIKKGFKLTGNIGDGINTFKVWTFIGNIGRLSLREKEGIKYLQWEKKNKRREKGEPIPFKTD